MNDSLSQKIYLLCRRTFYEPDSKLFVFINDFLSVITIVSILAIILETVSELVIYHPLFLGIEYVALFFFSLEYIGRIIGAHKKLSYIFSFFGIIDALAIFSTLLSIANLIPLKSARALRILRFLKMMRLSKVAHIQHHGNHKRDFVEIYRINLKIYILAITSILVILGSFVYVFERGTKGFENIPVSMLWVARTILEDQSVKFAPHTYGGEAVSLIARFFGVILLGFLIHIIGDLINRFLLGVKKIDRETVDAKQ